MARHNLQFATAIHQLVPEARLGGPAFEGTLGDVEVWPDAAGKVSFLGRRLDYLKAHGRLNDFTFFSFEHYPYQDTRAKLAWSDLHKEPGFVSHIIEVWKDDGLPPDLPFFMTEGNMTGGERPDVMSALWLADYVGSMMTGAASGTFYFHYMPRAGGKPGAFLIPDKDYHLKAYPPQYLATQVITKEWGQPVDLPHRLYKATSDVKDGSGNLLVTAHAVERPDAQWSVMLVNKDHDHDRQVKLVFADRETDHDRFFTGRVDRITFGDAEYQWHPEGTGGHPDPDGPLSKSAVNGGARVLYQLPRASIVVLRGRIGDE